MARAAASEASRSEGVGEDGISDRGVWRVCGGEVGFNVAESLGGGGAGS